MLDPDATEEEMEPEGHKVYQVDHTADQHLYDPSTPYKCPTEEVLHRAEAFWTGPHNSQVNTLESDDRVGSGSW